VAIDVWPKRTGALRNAAKRECVGAPPTNPLFLVISDTKQFSL
jgi:hypothetical protein